MKKAKIFYRTTSPVHPWVVMPSVYPQGHRGTKAHSLHWCVYTVVATVAPLSIRALRAGQRNVCFYYLVEIKTNKHNFFFAFCGFFHLNFRFKMFVFKV